MYTLKNILKVYYVFELALLKNYTVQSFLFCYINYFFYDNIF